MNPAYYPVHPPALPPLKAHACGHTPELYYRPARRMPYFVLCGCNATTPYSRDAGVAVILWNKGDILS